MKLVKFFLFIVLASCIYSNYLVFDSFVYQNKILANFNLGKQDLDPSYFDNFNIYYPSISATSLPLSGFKAFFLMKDAQYQNAISEAKIASSLNPVLKAPEVFIAESFLQLNQLDSAYHYSKIALSNLPNNNLHQDVFLRTAERRNDYSAIDSIFEITKSDHKFFIWYRKLYSLIKRKRDFDISEKLLAKEAISIFPDQEILKSFNNLIQNGASAFVEAETISTKAVSFYKSKNFNEALKYFEKASSINPIEYAYIENQATTLINLNELNKAQKIYKKILDSVNPNNGNPEYLMGYLLVKKDSLQKACKYFSNSAKLGNKTGLQLYNKYCN